MRVLGERYVVGPRLGKGGFADVYAGELVGALGFRRPVALKVLEAPNPTEVELSALLQHPNIVEVLDVLVDDGRVVLVMERADAGTLADVLDRGPLSVEAAAYVAHAVLAALEAAHGAGVVAHRDVTPQNVLLWADGQVKLTDFGIAKVPGSGATTKTGLVKGKLAYLSPEQVRQEPIDGRTDLWSLGVVLYEAVSGARPFGARGQSDAEALAQIAQARAPDLRPLRLPGWFEALLEGLLCPDPKGRWRSAADARRVLTEARSRWLDGQAQLVEALGSEIPMDATRDVRPPARGAGRVSSTADRPRTSPRSRAPKWGTWATMFVVVCLAGLAALASRSGWTDNEEVAPRKITAERQLLPLAPSAAEPVAPTRARRSPEPKPDPKPRGDVLRPEFFEPGGTLEVK